MRSKKKQEREQMYEKKKSICKVNPTARRVHSPLAILEQMIRRKVRPARSDLAGILDGDLRVGNLLVPDTVRIAIQEELQGKSHRGQKEVTIEWFLANRFNPVFDFEKLKSDHEKRGEKFRVRDITEAVLKANPIGSKQLQALRKQPKKG